MSAFDTRLISPTELEMTFRVQYSDCDPQNMAHHHKYVIWMEIARCELLRERGVAYADLEKADVYFVVAKLALRYRKGAFYDDVLRLVIRQTSGTRVKIEHAYQIFRDNTLLTEADTTLVCVDADGRPRVIPDDLAI